jgi:hypothetical protein
MVYQLDSYRYWERNSAALIFRTDIWENFTVDGLPDVEVSIGDRYRIGTALFEVSQPRGSPATASVSAWKTQMQPDGRASPTGFLSCPGRVKSVPATKVKVADGPEHMSVAEMDALLYLPEHPGN